jgi:Zn-dependent M32 family carboxypeptidase
LRSEKKQLIAANMTLTDAEALKFWTVYDQYAAELMKLYDARIQLIKEYAQNYEKLTDDQAKSLNQRSIDNDASFTKLRQKYAPLIAKVLPGKKSALFFQIEKRISLLMDLQVASEVPLVEL